MAAAGGAAASPSPAIADPQLVSGIASLTQTTQAAAAATTAAGQQQQQATTGAQQLNTGVTTDKQTQDALRQAQVDGTAAARQLVQALQQLGMKIVPAAGTPAAAASPGSAPASTGPVVGTDQYGTQWTGGPGAGATSDAGGLAGAVGVSGSTSSAIGQTTSGLQGMVSSLGQVVPGLKIFSGIIGTVTGGFKAISSLFSGVSSLVSGAGAIGGTAATTAATTAQTASLITAQEASTVQIVTAIETAAAAQAAVPKPFGFAGGGIVYAAAGFPAKGTDTVPAMLTPGESVLTVAQTRALMSPSRTSLSGYGPNYGNLTAGNSSVTNNSGGNHTFNYAPQMTGRFGSMSRGDVSGMLSSHASAFEAHARNAIRNGFRG